MPGYFFFQIVRKKRDTIEIQGNTFEQNLSDRISLEGDRK